MVVQSTYSFKARDATGTVVTGSREAESAETLSESLRSEGLFPLAVQDRPLRSVIELDANQIRANQAARQVRREDVIAFCQQMSVMLETGVPLTEALDAFCEQTTRREFRLVLDHLREEIYSGVPLSTAIANWPRVFPTLMVSLMKASEASGTMAMMLGRIGHYLAKERRTARQIKGAMGYPVFMMTAGLLMTVFLMAFVLPRFAKIYEARSASLPTPTRILLGLSDFVTNHYLVYGPSIVVLVVGMFLWVKRPSGRRFVDWLRLNVPVLKGMYRQLYITRAARTMATLLSAGVGLLDIIDICRGVTNNAYYDEMWDEMEDGIRSGKRLAAAVVNSPLIPPQVASMIASGERSGRLAQVMEKIAEFSEEELDASVKQVTSYIEPVMILLMGLVIGTIAIALLLPVFNMSQVMSGAPAG